MEFLSSNIMWIESVFLHIVIYIFKKSYLFFPQEQKEVKCRKTSLCFWSSLLFAGCFSCYLFLIAVLFQRWEDWDSRDLPRPLAGNSQSLLARLQAKFPLWAPVHPAYCVWTSATSLIPLQVMTWFPDPLPSSSHSLLDIFGQSLRKRWLQPSIQTFRNIWVVAMGQVLCRYLWYTCEQSNQTKPLPLWSLHSEDLHWGWGPWPTTSTQKDFVTRY